MYRSTAKIVKTNLSNHNVVGKKYCLIDSGSAVFAVGVACGVLLVRGTTQHCLPYPLNNPEHDSKMCS